MAVLLVTAVLYFRGIDAVPVYIGGDEARFAIAASSIAATGRDPAGHRFPLFFHLSDSLAADQGGTRWYQPLLFYLMALAFRFVPVTEQSMRWPAVASGLVDVFLIYQVARRLLGDRCAILAAALLALTPAHLIFSRQALDYICPLPFVLAWLWCLISALESGSLAMSLASGAILGVGFYSYIASWATMPMLLLLTWVALFRRAANPIRPAAAAAIGFALPVLIAVVWVALHPDMWRDMVERYKVYDARRLSPLQGLSDLLSYSKLRQYASVYWDYFNPAYLFFSGGSNLSTATRKAGVFLLPVGVFMWFGLGELWRRRHDAISGVLAAGLVIAPLPATLLSERYAIQRELVVLPFAILIAAFGASSMLRHASRATRLAGVLLLLAVPIQFAWFYQDYFNDYRIRSAFAFDPANFRGAAEFLIPASAGDAAAIYLSDDLDDVAARWRFFLIKHRREELLTRTTLFAAKNFDVRQVPAGSLIVLYASDPSVQALLGPDKCSIATVIRDAAGGQSAIILRKAS